MILDPNRTSAHGFTLSDGYGRGDGDGDLPRAQPAPLSPAGADDPSSMSPGERKIRAAVAEGSTTYRTHHPDFPVFLAKLARCKTDDDLSHHEASQLLKLAGVDNLTAARARSVRDAGIRSALAQATEAPQLTAGVDPSTAAAIHGLRQRVNADLDALASARAAAGSQVPPAKLRHEVESQLRAVATQEKHADVLASLDTSKRANWGNAIERAATAARDSIARASGNATLLLGPLSAIATVPAATARSLVSESAANWRDTKAVAQQLIAGYRSLTAPGGQAASVEDFTRLASFAQNQFPTAAQTDFRRRDDLVFQPHLDAKREEIRRQSSQIDRLHGERLQARTLEHYEAIVARQQVSDRLEKLETSGSRAFATEDKSVLRLLSDYAQLCPQTISPAELRHLARRNADVLLSAWTHPDPEVRTLKQGFAARFEAQTRTPLLDGNFDQRFRQLAYVDDPAIGSRDRRAHLKTAGARYQEHAALQDELVRLDAQCRQATSVRSSTQDFDDPVHADKLLRRQKQDGQRAAKLQTERRKTEAHFYRYEDDVRHYREGKAELIDPEGAVARTLTRPGSGLFLRIKDAFQPDGKSNARPASGYVPSRQALRDAADDRVVFRAQTPARSLDMRSLQQSAGAGYGGENYLDDEFDDDDLYVLRELEADAALRR